MAGPPVAVPEVAIALVHVELRRLKPNVKPPRSSGRLVPFQPVLRCWATPTATRPGLPRRPAASSSGCIQSSLRSRRSKGIQAAACASAYARRSATNRSERCRNEQRWRGDVRGLALEEAPHRLGALQLRDAGVEIEPIEQATAQDGVVPGVLQSGRVRSFSAARRLVSGTERTRPPGSEGRQVGGHLNACSRCEAGVAFRPRGPRGGVLHCLPRTRSLVQAAGRSTSSRQVGVQVPRAAPPATTHRPCLGRARSPHAASDVCASPVRSGERYSSGRCRTSRVVTWTHEPRMVGEASSTRGPGAPCRRADTGHARNRCCAGSNWAAVHSGRRPHPPLRHAPQQPRTRP